MVTHRLVRLQPSVAKSKFRYSDSVTPPSPPVVIYLNQVTLVSLQSTGVQQMRPLQKMICTAESEPVANQREGTVGLVAANTQQFTP